jgi:hypothetical protein
MSITSLSPQQLRQAADLKERIDRLQDQLNAILGGEVSTPNAPGPAAEPGRKKRKMTAAIDWLYPPQPNEWNDEATIPNLAAEQACPRHRRGVLRRRH